MDAYTKAWFELRADILKAMAHPTRLFLLRELSQHEICVYKLAELVNADISTVSKHLKILKQVGIISEEKRGTYAYFHVNMQCLGNFLQCLEALIREKPWMKRSIEGNNFGEVGCMEILIVGQECLLQKKLMQNVLDALHELQLECSLNIVHDMKEILELEAQQLLLTPALIVDTHILCEGHIWEKEHIKHFLAHVCEKKASSPD